MKLYADLASWWPLMSPPHEYEEEAAFYSEQLLAAGDQPARTCLELGSGGGNNASFMKAHFALTLVEPSAGMRDWSQQLNPECEHLEGDMRTVRLDRLFDRVFIHDAIAYMTTPEDLRKAIETAFVHVRPGGAVLIAPDHVRENFRERTEDGGVDDEIGRGMRWLAWCQDPDPSDHTYIVDYAFLLREADGTVTATDDRHIEGLFPRAAWLETMTSVGFEARMVPCPHSELEPGSYEVFLGIRPKS
jgi:SAM-dependent methyltransferase